MTASETIRIRVTPEMKKRLQNMYAAKGTTISQATREFYIQELAKYEDVATQIRELFDSVNKILAENDQPEPTIEEICAYVDAVREERMNRTKA